jgi:hypothetical protein
MRNHALDVSLAATLIALSGCSSGSSSSEASATASPAAIVAYDKRTGLPIYPGATAGNWSDGTPKYSLYITADAMQKIAAWYKSVLPSGYSATVGGGSDPYINLDKTAGGDLAERIDLTQMGAKTRIELDRYK